MKALFIKILDWFYPPQKLFRIIAKNGNFHIIPEEPVKPKTNIEVIAELISKEEENKYGEWTPAEEAPSKPLNLHSILEELCTAAPTTVMPYKVKHLVTAEYNEIMTLNNGDKIIIERRRPTI